jgi:protein-S-isoprenylcysteine O-methyltransferase Ste14
MPNNLLTNLSSPLIILIALAAWGLLHSFTASFLAKDRIKHWMGQRLSDGLYRLAYNLVSVITFLPVLALVGLLPDTNLYRFPLWLTFLTIPIQLLAALAAAVVLWQVDLPRFLGLRQLLRWAEGKPDPRDPPQLYTGGIYGYVRHPLYFFSLVLIWLMPIMTVNLLVFNLGATAYFYLGSIFEERKLVAEFGEAYREHQRHVPRLIPFPRRQIISAMN